MITDISHFHRQIFEIEQKIFNEEISVFNLQKMMIRDFSKTSVTDYYNNTFLNFPYEIEEASKEIGISIFATELLDIYHQFTEYSDSVGLQKINSIKEKRTSFKAENHTETITDFIYEFTTSLIFNYDKILANTQKHHFFTNIEDEKIILLNLLKLYKTILAEPSKQINIFWSIRLTKEISDIMLSMYIEFIEHRLETLSVSLQDINITSRTTFIKNDIKKIQWNGSQQELCELILELEKKNWIPPIANGERKQLADAVTSVFNLDKTRRGKESDTAGSFYQLLKGEIIDDERSYPFLHSEKYQKKFNTIKIIKSD